MKYILCVLFLSLFQFNEYTSETVKYNYISDCEWSNGNANNEKLSFICQESFVEDRFFDYKLEKKPCRNNGDGYRKDSIGIMQFENCNFSAIPVDIIEYYRYIWNLNISNVELKTLARSDFNGSHEQRLKKLVASHNLLIEIEPGLFNNAKHLREADFSFNNIERIDPSAFDNSKELIFLDLSNNNLAKLPSQTFRELRYLETLSLANNHIAQINASTLDGLINLKSLDLSQNEIQKIGVEMFDENSLKYLNLSQNGIDEMDDTIFNVLNDLEILDLSCNNISTLSDSLFNSAVALKELYVSNNYLNSIDDLATANFIGLTILDVSKNNISNLIEKVFDKLVNLVNVNLSLNPLKKFDGLTFAKQKNLIYLNLSETGLPKIGGKTFSRPSKLQSLDLSNNLLKKIDFKIFLPRFKDLEKLYLDGNNIKDLNVFKRAIFPRLHTLGIQNNKFNCSYLHTFLDSVIWHNLTVDEERIYSMDFDGTNVGGIRCTRAEEDSDEYTEDTFEQITESTITTKKMIPNSDGNTTLHIFLTILIILLIALLVYSIVLKRDKIMYYIQNCKPSYRLHNSESTLNVEDVDY